MYAEKKNSLIRKNNVRELYKFRGFSDPRKFLRRKYCMLAPVHILARQGMRAIASSYVSGFPQLLESPRFLFSSSNLLGKLANQ